MSISSSRQIIYRASRDISDLREIARQLTCRESTVRDILQSRDPRNHDMLSKAKCISCSGTGYSPEQDLLDGAVWVSSHRPSSNLDFDQVSVTDVDLARRVHAILEYHNPRETSFAFVGDDDLASLLLLHICSPSRVLVVDIDDRILNGIRENSAPASNTDLRLVKTDLSDWSHSVGLLGKESEIYDAVVMDPPYSDRGMLVFIYVASTVLKLGGRLYLAAPRLTSESWSAEIMQLIQRELISLGFVIDTLTPGFFTYAESEMLSALLVATKLQNVDLHSLTTKAEALNLQQFLPGQRYPTQRGPKHP
jgi:predicted methyltransferase